MRENVIQNNAAFDNIGAGDKLMCIETKKTKRAKDLFIQTLQMIEEEGQALLTQFAVIRLVTILFDLQKSLLDASRDVRQTDLATIAQWVRIEAEDRDEILPGIYRMELEACIFIFYEYKADDGYILSGMLIKRTVEARAQLLNLHSKFLAGETFGGS